MANRRMFLKEIVEGDPFVTMPPTAQALYFHLCMNADDDGFLNSPVKIQRGIGATDEDFSILCERRFVLTFENGVVVIKHWRMQNSIRKDRYTPTKFQDLFQSLSIKENGAYTDNGNQTATSWQPDGNQTATQYRLDKVSVGKGREVNVPSISIPTVPESICSLSNDNECGTRVVPRKDVRLVTEAWNALGLTAIKDIKPDTERGRMVKKRILDYGVDEVLNAIRNVGESPFLMGKTGKFRASFDWFIRPNNFQKVLEGNYADRQKRTYEETDMPLRAARTLGRLVSERTGLPKPKERDLQIWAAELEDCVAENETDFDRLADLMAFSQENPFWRKNVLDAASLRKHYRKMMADMNDGGRE